MFNRQTRISKTSNESNHANGDVTEKLKIKIANVSGKLINNITINHCEPSTSKSVDINLPVRRAKMIRIEKNDSTDDDEDEEENNYPRKPKQNSTYNGKRKLSLSSSSSSSCEDSQEMNEDSASLRNGVTMDNDTEIENTKNNEENSDESDESNAGTDENEESEESKEFSDIECKLRNGNAKDSTKKTVKVLYPKRIKSDETVTEHKKENFVVGKQVNNNTRHERACKNAKVNTKLNKGKYPLRQTAKKCLAELSSDESTTGAHYKTRRTSRRAQNGFSLYVEHSEESENDSEFDEEQEKDGSDYSPPAVKMPGRGCKRRRSSDSTVDWNSGSKGIYQRLRKSDSLQKSKNKNEKNRRGRTSHTRKSIRNNSESEVSLQSNISDSDSTPAISVSSRGRVRKLTPRARALLRD